MCVHLFLQIDFFIFVLSILHFGVENKVLENTLVQETSSIINKNYYDYS